MLGALLNQKILFSLVELLESLEILGDYQRGLVLDLSEDLN